MKQLIFILLYLSVMFSSPLYAEWTKVNKDEDGNTNYIDFESIKKVDGYVYWWILSDIARPTIQGHLSSKTYNQGDCKLFRFKYLSWIFYTEPMGAGDGDSGFPKDTEWNYPPPNSVMENILRIICSG